MAGDDVLAAAKTILAGEWGVSVSYRISPAASGSAASTVVLTAIPGRELATDPNVRRRSWEVPVASVPAAKRGDRLTVASQQWEVDEVRDTEGGYTLVEARILHDRPG